MLIFQWFIFQENFDCEIVFIFKAKDISILKI